MIAGPVSVLSALESFTSRTYCTSGKSKSPAVSVDQLLALVEDLGMHPEDLGGVHRRAGCPRRS